MVGEVGFNKIKINDKIKNKFANNNNIPLLRIPETLMELDKNEIGKKY